MSDVPTTERPETGHADGVAWSAWTQLPDRALRAEVIGYTGYRASSDAAIVRRQAPGTIIPIVISFDAPYRIRRIDQTEGARLDSFLAGLHDRSVIVAGGRAERCVQIDFTPLGLRRLLGVPMDQLANRTISLDEVLGPAAGELAERLYEARSWQDRFALIDRLLAARLRATEPVAAPVAWAWSRLEATAGRARISDLTSELGWSRKRLGAAFRSDVGLPPKTVARVLRFEHARGLLASGEAAIAAAASAGYADQPHMIREFVALTGDTPSNLNGVEVPELEEQLFNLPSR